MSKSPSLRRIQADIRELALDPSDRYQAAPMENDMFEWHFTIRGADGTDFEGGVYHGRILLPPDYPYKPPHIVFLTPSGRFETGTKVCLSFSAYHPELWQPAWGIRLILEALISFLPTPADGAIGALDWSSAERKTLAGKSRSFQCPCCGPIVALLPKLKKRSAEASAAAETSSSSSQSKPSRFQKEIEQLQLLQQQEHRRNDDVGENDKGEGKGSKAEIATDVPEVESPPSSGGDADAPSSSSSAVATRTTSAAAASVSDPSGARGDAGGTDAGPDAGAGACASTSSAADAVDGDSSTGHEEPIDPHDKPSDSGATGDAAAADDAAAEATVATPATGDAAADAAAEATVATPATGDADAVAAAVSAAAIDATEDPHAADDSDLSGLWWWDPLMQVGVVLLSIICYLLTKQVQQAWDELQRLQASLGEDDATGSS